jgi:hypothetical protein
VCFVMWFYVMLCMLCMLCYVELCCVMLHLQLRKGMRDEGSCHIVNPNNAIFRITYTAHNCVCVCLLFSLCFCVLSPCSLLAALYSLFFALCSLLSAHHLSLSPLTSGVCSSIHTQQWWGETTLTPMTLPLPTLSPS